MGQGCDPLSLSLQQLAPILSLLITAHANATPLANKITVLSLAKTAFTSVAVSPSQADASKNLIANAARNSLSQMIDFMLIRLFVVVSGHIHFNF